ncbi:MAG: RHS repeat-associated core domain-containing protein [Candidatus Nanopelagicales bacterium]
MSSVSDYDEYGIVVTATAPSPYGWVGSAMRSSANQGGLIQMGARMYNPATGRFLTTDPVPGRTPNPYTYPPDPVNMYDLAGTWSIGGAIQNIVNTVRKAVQWVANKATAGFSAVVRAVTFGRININIPKIKIPKFNIRTAVDSSRRALNGITNHNWGKAAAGGLSIWEGAGFVGLGRGISTYGAARASVDDTGGGSAFVVGLGVQAYGVGVQIGGLKSLVEGLTEGCPRGECTLQSQFEEFNKQQFDNFTLGKGQPPFA